MKIITLFLTAVYILIFVSDTFSQSPYPFQNFPVNIDTLRAPGYKAGYPVAADLNNDGKKDIIAVGYNYITGTQITCMIHVIQITGQELQGFPIGFLNTIHDFAVGDINEDGYLDIALRADDSIYVFDHNGNNLAGFPIYYPTLSVANWTPRNFINLFDLDGDGKLEIITCQNGALAVFDYHGQMKSGWPKPTIGKINANPAIGDLDGDGKVEIVTTQFKQLSGTPSWDSASINIFKYDGAQFSNKYPIYYDSLYLTYLGSPTIYTNINPSNAYIIVPLIKSNIMRKYLKLNINGDILKTVYFELSGYVNDMTMIMGDIDKNGQLEYATGGFEAGYMDLYLFDSQLNIITGWPQTGSTNLRTPLIAKLTSGSDLNIITSGYYAQNDLDSVHGFVYGYSKSGTPLAWSPLRPVGIVSGICVSDLNNDGSIEIISTGNLTMNSFLINVWTIPDIIFNFIDFPWPMYCHDRYRTNQYGFIPPDEPIGIQPTSTEVPDKFVLLQNYPNPFNPATTIKYQVRTSSLIKLIVYDVLGREVSHIVNENQKPGTYSVSFDGSNLSSGVYYYRLTTNGEMVDTKKMMMIK